MAEALAIFGAVSAGTGLLPIIFKLLNMMSTFPSHTSPHDRIQIWVDSFLFLEEKFECLRIREGNSARDFHMINRCQKEARKLGDLLIPFSSAVEASRRSRLDTLAFMIRKGNAIDNTLGLLHDHLLTLAVTQGMGNLTVQSFASSIHIQSKWTLFDLNARSNDGISLRSQGRLHESETVHRFVLRSRRQLQGRRHPETVRTKANLAIVINEMGRHEEAERMHREALRAFRYSRDAFHPDVIKTWANLADTLHDQGKYIDAEMIVEAILRLAKAEHKLSLTQMLRAMEHHAILLHHLGYRNAAREVAIKLLKARVRYLGRADEDTQRARAHVQSLEVELGYAKADGVQGESVRGKHVGTHLRTGENCALLKFSRK